MPPRATVVIPTHDHGRLLFSAARCALDQTVADLELFIVGDGVPDVTREVVAELDDERVRFFDNPKAPSRGEVLRRAALAEAGGEIVCYLADDDLWMPHHVATMLELLADADFAGSPPLRFFPEREPVLLTSDLALPYWRELVLSGTNRVPLSCGAHTLAMYRRLPHGWRTTPEGTPTDLHMWQQFLSDPSCRAVSAAQPTALNFPDPGRQDWPTERRVDELERWRRRMADLDTPPPLAGESLELAVRSATGEEARLRARVETLERRTATAGERLSKQRKRTDRLEERNRELTLKNRALREENRRLRRRSPRAVARAVRRRLARRVSGSG